jgi:hypothetical protein
MSAAVSELALRSTPLIGERLASRASLLEMRSMIAAQIAITILWAVDGEFDNGKITQVVEQMISSMIGRPL